MAAKMVIRGGYSNEHKPYFDPQWIIGVFYSLSFRKLITLHLSHLDRLPSFVGGNMALLSLTRAVLLVDFIAQCIECLLRKKMYGGTFGLSFHDAHRLSMTDLGQMQT